MIDFKNEAQAIREQIVTDRRVIHGYAELGFELDKTVAYVMDALRRCGIEPKRCGRAGVTGVIGQGGQVLILRGDMDALPMAEETGLPFASDHIGCHSCGHDCHTAMLLGAARLLKAHEKELKGRVKLMFQPAEELLGGAADMIAAGLMEDPPVDAAIGMHVATGAEPLSNVGAVSYFDGYSTYSGDYIRIDVVGKQAHGSMPQVGVDAINIAAHITIALQELMSRETSMTEPCVVLVGKIEGGSSCNTMSGECSLDVSVRTASAEMRAFLKQRVKEIAEGIARTYRGEAKVTFVYGMPPMFNHPDMVACVPGYLREIIGEENVIECKVRGGTEDFTAVAELVPSIYVNIGAGHMAGEDVTNHNPKVIFDENVLPVGAAVYAHMAARYLEEHGK